jgi:hypothetical protein
VHKFAAFILLFAFLGQTFDQGFYYLDYLVEKKEYMKRCENISRPELQCKGKCQLMKKIRAQQEKEQGHPPAMKLAGKTEIISPYFTLLIAAPVNSDNRLTFIHQTMGVPIDRASSLFHPPNLA